MPWPDTRPRDPYVDPQGRVWFVGQEGNYIAYLEPKSGEFKRFEIEDGAHPHNLIVDQKGIVWYAGNRNARIGRGTVIQRSVHINPTVSELIPTLLGQLRPLEKTA